MRDGRAGTCSRDGERRAVPAGDRRLRPVRRRSRRVQLRLVPRQKVERVVEVRDGRRADAAFDAAHRRRLHLRRLPVRDRPRQSTTFSRRGVFSCYRPVDPATPMPGEQTRARRRRLARAAATSPTPTSGGVRRATPHYYLSTVGPALLVRHPPAQRLPRRLPRAARPAAGRDAIRHRDDHRDLRAAARAAGFHGRGARRTSARNACRSDLRHDPPDRADDESVLAWAREPYACIIFNLHVVHTPGGHRARGGRFPPPDRPGHRARRQLLPDLSPLRQPRRRSRPAIRSFPNSCG